MEVLKQDRNSPVPVELQVVIIYAVTKGYLKNVPVHMVRDYQEKLFAYMRDEHPEVLQNILDTKDLTAENETALQEALVAFGGQYNTEV